MVNRVSGLLLIFLLQAVLLRAQETGLATYYADKYHNKSKTASGELYDRYKLTAAHKTLPLGTWVRVTNLSNGLAVTVRINDRGPFTRDRIIDLSYAAAQQIDMIRLGEVKVRVDILGDRPPQEPAGGATLPPAKAGEDPFKYVDVSGLPLRDASGKLIEPEGELILPPGESGGLPPRPYPGPSTAPAPAPARDPMLEDALKFTPSFFLISAAKVEVGGYGIQVGAYFSYYKLMEALHDFDARGITNTLIHNSIKDNKPVFRIVLGPYNNRQEADAARKKLAASNVKGIVVNLAEMQ